MDKVQRHQEQKQLSRTNQYEQIATDHNFKDPLEQNIQQEFSNEIYESNSRSEIKTKNQKHNQYRPDIDGLRAIAITLVVIFHAWPESLTGGYIGVDVFFVISGYLITSIILKEARQNNFSYLQFYSRRIKRIYPALILVLIFTLFVGVNYSQQRNLQIMSKTMSASTLFAANLEVLTYQQDYFDPQVKTNPLLHLWSLGVQQQFYIIWPLFITFIVKMTSSMATKTIGIFTVASFLLNVFAVQDYTKLDFYFPFCRFWQMAAGGLIAYLNVQIKDKMISNILSISSSLLVLYTSFSITQNTLFPGYWALAPTIFSSCIILTKSSYINEKILSHQIVVFVGKISYPLYLWHWPLLVFSRILYPKGSDQIFSQITFIIVLSVVFSILTYLYVQNKLRFSKKHTVVIGLLTCMLLIGMVSFYTYHYPQKVSLQSSLLQEIDIQNVGEQEKQESQQVSQQVSQQTNDTNDQQQQDNIVQDKNPQDKYYFQKIGLGFLKNYQKLMIPGPDDYIVINKTSLPNASKNKNRTAPTKQKIQIIRSIILKTHTKPLKVQRKNRNQKYDLQEIPHKSIQFNVVNQGRQNQVFIIGDSFAQYIGWRFRKLYEQHLQSNKLDQFPTLVHIVQTGSRFDHCAKHYDFVINLIKKHKPKRVLFCYTWLSQFAKYSPSARQRQISHTKSSCPHQGYHSSRSKKTVIENFNLSMKIWKQFVDMGIEVYSAGVNPIGQNFNPQRMANKNQVIQRNIKPVKLSGFKKKHKSSINLYEKGLKEAGVKIIDFTWNHCWENVCEVAIPSGFPIFRDQIHYSYSYAFYWVSVVDFLVKF